MTERPTRPAGRISVCIRFGDGTEVSRCSFLFVPRKANRLPNFATTMLTCFHILRENSCIRTRNLDVVIILM